MPVTNIEDLYNITDYLLSGSREVLRENNITNVYVERSADSSATPYVTLDASLTRPLPCPLNVYQGKGYYVVYEGSLGAGVFTERTDNGSDHSRFVTKVINYLGDGSWINRYLLYHRISKIEFVGKVPEPVEEENIDGTIATFEFRIWIKQDAWPLEFGGPPDNGLYDEAGKTLVLET